MGPNERIQRAVDHYIVETGREATHIFIGRDLWNEARRSIYARAEERGLTLYFWNGLKIEVVPALPENAVIVGHALEVLE